MHIKHISFFSLWFYIKIIWLPLAHHEKCIFVKLSTVVCVLQLVCLHSCLRESNFRALPPIVCLTDCIFSLHQQLPPVFSCQAARRYMTPWNVSMPRRYLLWAYNFFGKKIATVQTTVHEDANLGFECQCLLEMSRLCNIFHVFYLD